MKNVHSVCVGVGVFVIGFVGGMQYTKKSVDTAVVADAAGRGDFGMRGNGSRGGAGGRGAGGALGGGGFVGGEIIAKDASSFTVKLRNGGSKIVLIDAKTQYKKLGDAVVADFVVGKQIQVMGEANTDGSVTAQTIQLRPDDMIAGAATSTKK